MRSLIAVGSASVFALGGLAMAYAAGTSHTASQQKTVGAYKLVLKVGPAEQMGPKGEMMMGGKNATCTMKASNSGMSMSGHGTCNRHLELHVYNKKNNHVITNAHVSITLTDTKNHMMIKVPIMTMEGAGKGMKDFHYGNNIFAAAGHYVVSVKVNSSSTSFKVTLM